MLRIADLFPGFSPNNAYIGGFTTESTMATTIQPKSPVPVFYALIVSNWLFFRICGPYLNSTQGIGNIVKDKKPSRLVAHAMPSLLYTDRIELANSLFHKSIKG